MFLATGDQVVNAQLDKFVSISATHIYADGKKLTCPCARIYAADDLIEFPDMWETAMPAGCCFQPGEGTSELDQHTSTSTA